MMGIESATNFMGGMVFGAAIVGAAWGYVYASRKEREAWAEYRRARADADPAKIDATRAEQIDQERAARLATFEDLLREFRLVADPGPDSELHIACRYLSEAWQRWSRGMEPMQEGTLRHMVNPDTIRPAVEQIEVKAENEVPKHTKSWPVIIYTIFGSGFLALAAGAPYAKSNPMEGVVPAFVGIGCAIMAGVYALYDRRPS